MNKWYSFKPVGTLFFRGASNANRGEDHSALSVFPPPFYTIEGALRTTILIQKGINFEEYGKEDFNNEEIIESIGKSGTESPFNVIGPLFKYKESIFIPAPYSWYYAEEHKERLNKENRIKVKIQFLKKIETNLIFPKTDEIYWVKPDNNKKDGVENCGGNWIKLDDIYSDKNEIELFTLEYFAKNEPRTGIGIDNRKGAVHEGHLYQFNHMRLKEDVSLLFGIDKDISLEDRGILKLGAEQRFGKYEKLDISIFNNQKNNSKYFLSLNIIEGNKETNENVIATGKIEHRGGWDLKMGFHKPMNI